MTRKSDQSDSESVLPPLDAAPVGEGLLRRQGARIAAGVVFAATVAATVLMFPPHRTPELAYVFAAPAVFWAFRAPGWKLYAGTMLGAQAVAWTILLGWLHNVTWVGLFLLGPVVGAWVGSWFLAARWVAPRLLGRPWHHRVLGLLGLGGAWVVIEWTRGWLLGGFPWLTLSASQWERLSLLQAAPYTGAWGVSFVLVVVNVATAAYAQRLLGGDATGLRKRSPEFLTAMALLLGCLVLTARDTFNRTQFQQAWARVGIVQPAIPQTLKWDEAEAEGIFRILELETLKAALPRPDLLLWPEATTPYAVLGDPGARAWTESLVRRARTPLVMGSIGIEEKDTPGERWYNGVFTVTPEAGLGAEFYGKRKRVPFGEYVPLRPVLGWLSKVVPVGDDFTRGERVAPLRVALSGGREAVLGPLICYEDIFPGLARASVAAGAEVLVVNTNSGWFGEGGAAYQHAAHAVLRAVETRRPVLRAGNAGWSGWIDECGLIRAVLTKDAGGGAVRTEPGEGEGTIYFRGSATLDVTRDSRFLGVQTFYVRWGDWFVAVGAGLALATWARLRRPYVAPVERDPAAVRRFKLD